MFNKTVPAVTVAVQHLNSTRNQRNAHESAGQIDQKAARLTGLKKGAETASKTFTTAGSSNLKQATGAAINPFALTASGAGPSNGNQGSNTETILSEDDKQAIKKAIGEGKNVYVAGFSSQGGGHTARMLTPLGMAAQQGDTIVLALPPHWEKDDGNEQSKLEKFTAGYKGNGVNVVTVQADKAIWGFYEPHGPSDNYRILKHFADLPKRDSSQTPLFGSKQTGQGFKHKDIVQQVVNVAGEDNIGQIKVFEDMDPYLGKAAKKSGIPQDQIVGQSNHVLLLDAQNYLGEKRDAFLVKANGNGHNGKMATIEFNSKINTTSSQGETFSKLGIKAEDKAVQVRKDMVSKLLEHGNRRALDSSEPVTREGAVMVSPNATADSIDRGVYVYLNDYNNSLAQHVRERLNGEGSTTQKQQEAYEKAMFVFCGGGTLPKDTPGSKNAMHIAQAAQFDGVASAGFGTTSEMHYLIENNAYQGNFVLMPIEQQHEQEANANDLLPAALKERNLSRVATANDTEDMKAKLDELVLARATTNAKLGETTMKPLLDATQRQSDAVADKAASLLGAPGPGMNDLDTRLLEENNWRSQEAGRKEMRQLNKVVFPLLEAISNGESEVTIKLSTKVDAVTVPVEDLINGLDNPATLKKLTGVNITNQLAREFSEELAADLRPIMGLPEGPVREYMADYYLKDDYANNKFNVGY